METITITIANPEETTKDDNPSRIFYMPVSAEEYERCKALLPKCE